MFSLPPLPYAYDALAPGISAETLHFHHDAHHAGYVKTLNALLKGKYAGTKYAKMNLVDLVISSYQDHKLDLFHNAGQHYNHSLLWPSLAPQATPPDDYDFKQAVFHEWGSWAGMRDALSEAAMSVFGSGWVFLCMNEKRRFSIVQTENAGTPLTSRLWPLLAWDLWEHASYLDYQNRRIDYIAAVWDRTNMAFAAKNTKKLFEG